MIGGSLLVARVSRILRAGLVCSSGKIQERHMMIELGNIHANVNHLYLTQEYYQQIGKRLIEVERVKG